MSFYNGNCEVYVDCANCGPCIHCRMREANERQHEKENGEEYE